MGALDVAVARVSAEHLEGAIDLGEAFAAFDGILPVGGGECEGDEREEREQREGDVVSHGCGCVVVVSMVWIAPEKAGGSV